MSIDITREGRAKIRAWLKDVRVVIEPSGTKDGHFFPSIPANVSTDPRLIEALLNRADRLEEDVAVLQQRIAAAARCLRGVDAARKAAEQ